MPKPSLMQVYSNVEPVISEAHRREYGPKRVGNSGMSLFEFIAILLQENEELPQNQRWEPDKQAAAINEDFNCPTKDTPGYVTPSKIAQRRTMYNLGTLLATKNRPYLIALRYKDHYPVVPSCHSKPACIHDLRKLCIKYRIADPRLVRPSEMVALRQMQADGINTGKLPWLIPPKEIEDLYPYESLELRGTRAGAYENILSA